MNNTVRIKTVHRRDMLSLISEFPVRTILNDKETVLLRQSDEHLALHQSKRLARRILEVRDHVEELDLLSCCLDLFYDFLI